MWFRGIVIALVASLCSLDVAAQDQTSVQLGAGLLGNGTQVFEEDVHLAASASAFGPWDAVGVRADVILGTQPVAGGSAALVLRWPEGGTRPYIFTGYGYQRTSQFDRADWKQDFGVVYGSGLVQEIGGREWYFEVSLRLFGNVFYERAGTQALIPFTVGLHF